MKIVVISAHPDDAEIACGGALKRWHDQGADITSVITVAPSTEVNPARNAQIVAQELQDSYNLSGWRLRIFATPLHGNGRPNLICDNNTMTELSQLIESCDLAIIPNMQDSHQDHKNTYNLSWPIVQRRAQEVWMMQSWPYCYHYEKNSANIFVGIDWTAKQKLLSCYSSYLDADKITQVENLNRVWGDKSGTTHAETFEMVYRYVR